MSLPCGQRHSVAVRFCPKLFRRRSAEAPSGQTYVSEHRMVFAVATMDSVLLYDTENQTRPVAVLKGLHYAALTDVAWSPDGSTLLLASEDGYCSIVSFDSGELGEVVPENEVPECMRPPALVDLPRPLATLPPMTMAAPKESAPTTQPAAHEGSMLGKRPRRVVPTLVTAADLEVIVISSPNKVAGAGGGLSEVGSDGEAGRGTVEVSAQAKKPRRIVPTLVTTLGEGESADRG